MKKQNQIATDELIAVFTDLIIWLKIGNKKLE